MSLKTEVESGDRLRALKALRGTLASRIEAGPDDKDLAALALRLERVLSAIEEIGEPETEEHDDLAAKRRAKLSAASGS